ncbi:hypothetical protein C5167_009304 [Papaver somniferum]|uniref:EXPERA domain-containing protein n=1 Tax=Papaver somniferum TaxID=3469 RepID=A0A4Y7JZW8_PAPSO|nr:sigma intracellular receptor 2-like [Papaver somniferum]RZC65612.1 hypothetical protein C5167_009304 [Papaver somniferum]
MGLQSLMNGLLLIYFLFMVIVTPLFDCQSCLPSSLFPDVLVDLNTWYANEHGDYLSIEKPHFFVGLIWLELIVMWPLCIANFYGIFASKSWVKKTCLIYGVSTATSMVAILSEMIRSSRASSTLLSIYVPFLGFALISVLNGLLPHSSSVNVMKTSAMKGKKRA